MSKRCPITGIGVASGNNVSHANNKTRRRWLPNLQTTSFFVPELGRKIRLRISTRAMRTIRKKGLLRTLRDEGLTLADVVR